MIQVPIPIDLREQRTSSGGPPWLIQKNMPRVLRHDEKKNIMRKDNISSGRSTAAYRQCLGSHIVYPGGTLGG